MDILISASIIAAFAAGVAALFAPCCITVLLPAYFASIFREKRKVFLMTFIFFLGILAVFLPIGLGAAVLGRIFKEYHNIIFGVGGLFLLALGATLLIGRHFSLPFSVSPAVKNHNVASVFVLGIFSGIATTCCAPVLAGTLALAILPGSIFWGAIYTLSYVFGMVAPLFIISLFLDKVDFTKKFSGVFQKPLIYSLRGQEFRTTISEFISGITFLSMGTVILYLALSDKLFVHSEYQTNINIFVAKTLEMTSKIITFVPEYAWAAALIILIGLLMSKFIKQLRKEKKDEKK